MKDLQLHMVNICIKLAEKELVGTQLYLLQSLGAQKMWQLEGMTEW